jgi:hypothetical protein
MPTITIPQISATTAHRRSRYALLLSSIAVLTAIVITAVLLLTRSAGSSGGGSAPDAPAPCRPAAVVHYC